MSAGYVYIYKNTFYRKSVLSLYISTWASALLVQTTAGSSKASNSGTSNRYRFPRFSFYNKYFSKNMNRPIRESEGKNL